MPQSIKPSLAFAILLAAGLMGGAFMFRSTNKTPHPPNDKKSDGESFVTADVRADRVEIDRHSHDMFRNGRTTSSRLTTTGVKSIAIADQALVPQMSGYVVDVFEQWTSIPAAYDAEGLILENGLLTLAADDGSTGPRTGFLRSPPLPLRAPSLAGPVENDKPLAPGQSLHLQISLSSDGTDWSPWVSVDRYHRPEGRLVPPSMQASIAKADLVAPDLQSSEIENGPFIRYQLHISASSATGPSVADIRIWKREPQ